MAAFDGMKVTVPALYIAGDHDMVVASPGAAEQITNMKQVVPCYAAFRCSLAAGTGPSKSALQRSALR